MIKLNIELEYDVDGNITEKQKKLVKNKIICIVSKNCQIVSEQIDGTEDFALLLKNVTVIPRDVKQTVKKHDKS